MSDSENIYVLLVDDNKDTRLSISETIRHTGGNVVPISARNAEEAIDLLESYDFALALIDVIMPGRGGFALADHMARHSGICDVPIIFITGEAKNTAQVLKGYAKGAVDYLIKPVHPVILKAKVRFFIEQYRNKMNVCAKPRQEASVDKREFRHQVGRVISDLAGGIAHQFNNSLNIITGNVELLKMDVPNNDFVREFSEVVFDSVKKMTVLTDKLLAYARAGHYNPCQMEFNGVLKQVLAEIDKQGKTVTVESCLDPGLIQVDADEDQLKIVFSALLKNAFEAVSDKGSISVRTRYLPIYESFDIKGNPGTKNMVCFEVEDNGQGMDTDTVSRIFEPFFSTKFQGRGLDMAAVYGIVSNHEGFIDVDSDVGKGTRVSVFLPVSNYREPTVFHSPESWGTATGNVLVIDDEDDLRGLTVIMLKRLGYNPLTAATGKEAIDLLGRSDIKVDLALLDIEMPDMKGNEIYPYLKSGHPDLKVVVCSGYSLDGPVQEILEAGASMFLQKPFSFGTLAASLQKLIERRKTPRYEVREGFIIIPEGDRAIENDLIDISRGGASIHSFCHPEDHNSWKNMTISAKGGAFQIPDIPFQFIATNPFLRSIPQQPVKKERLNLRFGVLNSFQSRRVEDFISNFAR